MLARTCAHFFSSFLLQSSSNLPPCGPHCALPVSKLIQRFLVALHSPPTGRSLRPSLVNQRNAHNLPARLQGNAWKHNSAFRENCLQTPHVYHIHSTCLRCFHRAVESGTFFLQLHESCLSDPSARRTYLSTRHTVRTVPLCRGPSCAQDSLHLKGFSFSLPSQDIPFMQLEQQVSKLFTEK